MPKHLIEIKRQNLEKAFVVILDSYKEDISSSGKEEMLSLVASAGCRIKDYVELNLRKISAYSFIGKGQAEEVSLAVKDKEFDVVIFNVDLSASQQRNLEDIIGIKTIDRSQLILDIFARHAKSAEGKLQVELAQLEYMLPRLKGKGIALSRLGGGIGTKGPGEKKLEVDRRRITERVDFLKKEIEKIGARRDLLRKQRGRNNIKTVSLVGYTNAGKTTLFNLLCSEHRKSSPYLFTTLDTLSRKVEMGEGKDFILSDTVGFIQYLPAKLREAFRATLQELEFSDLLLHVVDASSDNFERSLLAVEEILSLLGLDKKRVLYVFNKTDKMPVSQIELLKVKYPAAIFISAKENKNIAVLLERAADILFLPLYKIKVCFDAKDKSAWGFISRHAKVGKFNFCGRGKIEAVIEIGTEALERLRSFEGMRFENA